MATDACCLTENESKMRKDKPSKLWIVGVVASISVDAISVGLYYSLPGPTLLYLAGNVHSTVGQVSSMFTGRSAGVFLGTAAFGMAMNRFKAFQPLKVIAFMMIAFGCLSIALPWIRSLAGLIITTSISGFAVGFSDTGLQSVYLRLWGEKKSRPYIQGYHFCTGVGGLLAPVLATPFIEMANLKNDPHARCPTNSTYTETRPSLSNQSDDSSLHQNDNFNPVAWAYIIFGGYVLLAGLVIVILAALHIEDHIEVRHQTTTERREEEPLTAVLWLFIPILLFYCSLCGVTHVFSNYLYSMVLCSSLSFSVSEALTLNTVYFVGYTLSRLVAIGYTKFFQPSTMIGYCLTGATIGLMFLLIFGQSIPLLIWIVSPFYAGFVAILYPTGVSWTSRITNVSKTYILIFGLGNTIAQMTMLPLAGSLFELNPFYVIYLIGALTVGMDVSFLWMSWIAKKHTRKRKKISADVFPDNKLNTSRLI